MIKIENTEVFGIESAMRGMRNPKNSWSKNDTVDDKIGENDMRLAKTLIKGGQPHRKFLRQIFVTADFTMPAYLAAEFDTYKVGTTRDSCSLQHKGDSREFTEDDFTFDGADDLGDLIEYGDLQKDKKTVIDIINKWRNKWVDGKTNYSYFRIMRQFIPMSYNYKFTWSGNYEVLLNMWEWRHNHKLKEWHEICKWIESLPNMKEFLNLETNKEVKE